MKKLLLFLTMIIAFASVNAQRVSADRMKLKLKDIVVDDTLIWYQFEIKNSSLIDHKPRPVRAFLRDRKLMKRTAMQEVEIAQVASTLPDIIAGKTSLLFVIAYKQFTVPRNKKFVIHISEPNGARALTLNISHRRILRARRF
jgi:hypothetical protein